MKGVLWSSLTGSPLEVSRVHSMWSVSDWWRRKSRPAGSLWSCCETFRVWACICISANLQQYLSSETDVLFECRIVLFLCVVSSLAEINTYLIQCSVRCWIKWIIADSGTSYSKFCKEAWARASGMMMSQIQISIWTLWEFTEVVPIVKHTCITRWHTDKTSSQQHSKPYVYQIIVQAENIFNFYF